MCTCADFGDLPFERQAVSRRIRDTVQLKKLLGLVGKHPTKQHRLYRCDSCGQLWQCSRAWNWGNKDYLFKVPAISVEEWNEQAYVHPSQLMESTWAMGEFLSGSDFATGTTTCAVPGCSRLAVRSLRNCLKHHVEDLRRVEQLGPEPSGRWFPPYEKDRCVPAL